ncbi:glycine zipper 2TM domain-containing protein [Massilia sp. R2A-15]|uniref:glycine zipper 2TM domain-containing protein n=1 Tax=Massilia sp. R2A-15 TaxID=3064278 RepID=UPI002734CA8B|nr:glycine zipper 2TM domain-containing protein [Massilia sp. R2A-15]WLI90163.1 glycine zipper 2TM domain-containing protein [Massilia sp. R2A-15]
MESIKTATRIHPLMAAAAASVIIVSVAGTAAITGLLPSSRGAVAPEQTPLPTAAPLVATPAAAPMNLAAATPQPVQPQQLYVDEPAPAPVHKAPAVKHAAPRHVVHHQTQQVAHNDYNDNYRAPAVQQAPQPAKPNYVGIGVGAVVGGLLGNQVGSGNGRKLATVAGAIGGGMLGNQIANQNR